MIGIYKFTNKYNRNSYIGKSTNIELRYKNHIRAALYRNEDTFFYRALRKYGIEGFDFDILIELPWLEGHTKEEIKLVLNYWETFYIKYYCSNNQDFGYNMTAGGDGGNGMIWTEERSKNASEIQHIAQLKYWATEDGKEKAKHHSEVMRGRKASQETRNKMSVSQRGKKHKMPENFSYICSISHLGLPGNNKGKHRVWNDETHTKYHYE